MKVKELIAALTECEMDDEVTIDTTARTVHITGINSKRKMAELELSHEVICASDVEST